MKTKTKLLLLCIAVLLGLWKAEAISSRILRAKAFIRTQYLVWKMHRPETDISHLQAFSSTGDEWFSKYHFIAHNGGIINGRLSSDSREAWEFSYSRGLRIIDVNLNFTADNHLVVRHGWDNDLDQAYFPRQPDYQEFKAEKIFMKYTPLDAEDLVNFMLSHSDLYAAIDSKQKPEKIYSALVNTARSMKAEEILSRIIVSLYNMNEVHDIKAIYPFKHFVLRQYFTLHNWYTLADFCLKNDVRVVNVWNTVIDRDPEGIKILTSKGIRVYSAVVNSLKQMQAHKDLGITGAVSDYLSESDWELLK